MLAKIELSALDLRTGDTIEVTDFGGNHGTELVWRDVEVSGFTGFKIVETPIRKGDVYFSKDNNEMVVVLSESFEFVELAIVDGRVKEVKSIHIPFSYMIEHSYDRTPADFAEVLKIFPYAKTLADLLEYVPQPN